MARTVIDDAAHDRSPESWGPARAAWPVLGVLIRGVLGLAAARSAPPGPSLSLQAQLAGWLAERLVPRCLDAVR